MAERRLFVYGTLRPGQYNFDRFPHEGVRVVNRNCTVSGFIMHNVHGHRPIYPVVIPGHADDIIVGDLLAADDDSDWYHDVMAMEIGAGYEPEEVPVLTRRKRPPRTVTALMFVYQHRPRGVPIESGNWLQFTEQHHQTT